MSDRNLKKRKLWKLPLLYALPFVVILAVFVLIWGRDIRDLIQVAVKLVVNA